MFRIMNWIGYLFIIVALFLTYRQWQLISHGLKTTGVVIEIASYISENDDGARIRMYRPVIEFQDSRKQKFLVDGRGSSSKSGYKVGDRVHLFYHPENPEGATIDAFFEVWVGPIVCGIIGSIFAMVGFLFVKFYREEKKSVGKADPFDSAFFAHSREDKGRFKSVMAKITEVEKGSSDHEVSFSLQCVDEDSGELFQLKTNRGIYSLQNGVIDFVTFNSCIGRSIKITYDRNDRAKYHFDPTELFRSQ